MRNIHQKPFLSGGFGQESYLCTQFSLFIIQARLMSIIIFIQNCSIGGTYFIQVAAFVFILNQLNCAICHSQQLLRSIMYPLVI